MSNPMMILTPYSGEVLLQKSSVEGYRVDVEWSDWGEIPTRDKGMAWLAAEGWMEMVRGDITVPAEVTEFVKSIQ